MAMLTTLRDIRRSNEHYLISARREYLRVGQFFEEEHTVRACVRACAPSIGNGRIVR